MILEHRFTSLMTDHSINILSVLKMSSSGPYASEKISSPLIALSTAMIAMPNVQQFLNFMN